MGCTTLAQAPQLAPAACHCNKMRVQTLSPEFKAGMRTFLLDQLPARQAKCATFVINKLVKVRLCVRRPAVACDTIGSSCADILYVCVAGCSRCRQGLGPVIPGLSDKGIERHGGRLCEQKKSSLGRWWLSQVLALTQSPTTLGLAMRLLLATAQEFVGPARSAHLLSSRRSELQQLLQAGLGDVLRVLVNMMEAACTTNSTMVCDARLCWSRRLRPRSDMPSGNLGRISRTWSWGSRRCKCF